MMHEEITLHLDPDKALKLVELCSESDFDVNVLCGSKCFDGESILSVMDLCGRTVTIAPVGVEDYEYEAFRAKIKEIGDS